MDDWYHWQAGDLILSLRVQPNARCDEIVGPHVGRLRVRITAQAMEGRANAHLVRFLAKVFAVPRGRVTLLRGERSRDKRLRVTAPRKLLPGMLEEG